MAGMDEITQKNYLMGIDDKLEILAELGFTVDYERIWVFMGHYNFNFRDVEPDKESILISVIEQSLYLGKTQGSNEKVNEINRALELKY